MSNTLKQRLDALRGRDPDAASFIIGWLSASTSPTVQRHLDAAVTAAERHHDEREERAARRLLDAGRSHPDGRELSRDGKVVGHECLTCGSVTTPDGWGEHVGEHLDPAGVL